MTMIPPKIVFMSEAYLKAYSPINGSVDPNLIYPAVYIAQDMHLAPWLGDALYERLKADVENSTLSGNYLTLMNDYVLPSLMWYCILEALPALTYKINNGTIVQYTSDNTQPITGDVMKEMRMNAVQKAEYYAGRLEDYLCANSTLFPEYTSNTWPQRCPKHRNNGGASYGFSRGNSATGKVYGTQRLSQIP